MKKKFVYTGYVKVDYKKFVSLMKLIYGSGNIRDRFSADIQPEINYEDKNSEIYISEADEGAFLFSAEFKGTLEEAESFIVKIVESLKNNGVTFYQFEWNEVDDEGNQIGEEYEINS